MTCTRIWQAFAMCTDPIPANQTLRLNDRRRRLPGTEKLGKGEAEAILLAKEVGADILLTDDRKARAAAVSLNVRCIGLLSLLILAKPMILNPLLQWSKTSRSRAAFTCRPTSRSKPQS